MNIAVIAADGRSGKAFVAAAAAAGHRIVAGMRKTTDLTSSDQVQFMTCDATVPEDIRQLIRGQDAVVSFIGHIKGSPANVQTQAITNTIAAMQEQGIRRIVSLTGTGVRLPKDKITLIDRVLNMSIALIDPARVKDGKNHVKALQQSPLDWTIIRVLKLQNTKPAAFCLSEHGPTKPYVSRRDVAAAVLQVLEQNTFLQAAPIMGSCKNSDARSNQST